MFLELKENRAHGTKEYPYEQYHMHDILHAFQVPVHWHNEVEIIYIENGKLHVKIGEDDLEGEEDDIFFVNARELHLMGSSDGVVEYYTLLFPIEFVSFQTMDSLENALFAPLRSNRLRFPRRIPKGEKRRRILPILHQLIENNRILHEQSEYELDLAVHQMQTRIDLLRIMQILYEEELFSNDKKHEKTNMQKEILAYIQAHFMEKITLGNLADEFHLSEKYMSHYFVEHFQLPFSNYVLHLRLTHAKQLLESSDDSITDVAMLSGFTNVSYFIRSFKSAYGMSPLQYRKSLM